MISRTLHRFIAILMKKRHDFFISHISSAEDIQEKILLHILKANKSTRFGKEHHFEEIRNAGDYKKKVPVRTWEDFLPYLNKEGEDKNGELVSEPVLLYEPTSGSSSPSKLVPYTSRLKHEFTAGIHTWIYDLYKNIKDIKRGTHYWSISPPAIHHTPTGRKKKAGFNEDSEYLGPLGSLMRRVFAIPSRIKKISVMKDFLYTSAYFLMRSSDLSLISVWSPDYLLRLLNFCMQNAEAIIRDIHDGTLSTGNETLRLLKSVIKPDRERSRYLDKILEEFQNHGDESVLFAFWWPNLALVSAWEDGASEAGAELLKKKLSHTRFQGKGLLATEGIISFPLTGLKAPVCAYTSHFLEFIPAGGRPEDAVCLREVETGRLYSVVMTTGGGLYRYAIGDIVRIEGRFRELPLLRFIVRDSVSDMVGEKLSEPFVREVLETACRSFSATPDFLFLAPVRNTGISNYVLFIEDKNLSFKVIKQLANLVEKNLRDNYHYDYAIRLGQLNRVKAYQISSNAAEIFTQRLSDEGMNTGSIKRMFLDKRFSWDQYFTGEYITDENNTD